MTFEKWMFRQCPPHALAIARIAWGLWGFFYVGRNIVHLPLLMSREGIPLPLYLDYVPGVTIAYVLFAILLLAYIGFIVGYRMRLSTIIIILMSLYFWQLSFHLFIATFHRLYLLLFIVFLFSGADRTFSVWAKQKRGSFAAWEPISIFPQRLIALQMTITYLGSGWQKLLLLDWQGGAILKYSFISAWASPLARWIIQLPLPDIFYDAAVYITKFFGFFMPFGLWIRKIRIVFFLFGAFFHISIALLLSVWSFFILIPLYIVFLEPEEIHKWCQDHIKIP